MVKISFVTDGCSCVVVNGEVVVQGSQFSLRDIEVVTAQVDLDAVCYTFAPLWNMGVHGLQKYFIREHCVTYVCQLILLC